MSTPRLELVEMPSNPLNPENIINDNINILDGVIQLAIINATTITPPVSPTAGDTYIPATGATGAWAGHDNKLAVYNNGWIIITPKVGWVGFNLDTLRYIYWNGVEWGGILGTVGISGPISSTDNAIAKYNGALGEELSNTGVYIDDNNALYGQKALINEKTASYQLVAADSGKVITVNTSDNITITLPETATTPIGAGFQCVIIRRGTGTVTFAKQGSETMESIDNFNTIANRYGAVSVLRVNVTTWAIFGDLG